MLLFLSGVALNETIARESYIHKAWLEVPRELEALNDKDCTPSLKEIVNVALDNHFKII